MLRVEVVVLVEVEELMLAKKSLGFLKGTLPDNINNSKYNCNEAGKSDSK